MMRGHGKWQRLRIGQADVLRRQDDQAARDKARVLVAGEHLGEPVQRGVRIAAAAALDEGGDRVVVFVLVGIVADVRSRAKISSSRR